MSFSAQVEKLLATHRALGASFESPLVDAIKAEGMRAWLKFNKT
jgi:hypothetical protein